MDFLLDALTDWLKEMLVGGIMSNLSGMFDSVNQQVADIATQVGQTPQGWNGSIFSMIQNLSNSIMVPIAGVILAITKINESRIASGRRIFVFLDVGCLGNRCLSITPNGTFRNNAKINPIKSGFSRSFNHITASAT